MRGVDVSTVLAEEASGVVYKNAAGQATDIFQLLANAGVNYVRVRIWNNPFNAQGQGYGAGNCTVSTAIAIGLRAKAYGMKLLADFHYSDFWADPSKYAAPKAWASMTESAKEQALYDYTLSSVKAIESAGVSLGMVQVGNETTVGVAGVTGSNMYKMLAKGASAVRAADPNVLVAIHVTDPENGNYASIAANLQSAGVNYDVFLSSYYPYWHGTTANLTSQLSAVASQYGKKVGVAETSWAYTFNDPDGGNVITSTSGATAYPISTQGQASEVRDVIAAVNAVPNGKGIGVFYWEPAWLAVPGTSTQQQTAWLTNGSGWATPYAAGYAPDAPSTAQGSQWDNQALFAADGTASDALNVFNYVYTGSGTPTAPATNLLTNPSFEQSTMTPWVFHWNKAQGSINTRANQPADAHDGSYIINVWNSSAMDFYVEQTVTGLAPGKYTATAAVQGNTGYNDSIWLYLKDGTTSAAVTSGTQAVLNGYGSWQLPQVTSIEIDSGTATIGMSVKLDAQGWAAIDDFRLTKAS